MPANSETPERPAAYLIGSWALIGTSIGAVAIAFGYTGGWLAPHRLTPKRLVDQLQVNSGTFSGYRRNHAKGVCVTGFFQSSGDAAPYSAAQVFAPGRTPVVGRFAIPGGNPYAPDSSGPIRSMALRFALANGQQWRTGMNSMPVFPVSTPQAFYAMLEAQQPDPVSGKPDPRRLAAFFTSHPETAAFRAWVKTAKPSSSFATDTYYSLDAFVFTDATGTHHAVRWSMVPETPPAADVTASPDEANYLANDLAQRLSRAPLRWHLLVTLANPGDPIDDATKEWPATRRTVDAGTLVVERTESQASGPCRDVNYDPTVLPDGIEPSDDPLLAARSAAYAVSYLRRTGEEAHLPGTSASHSAPKPRSGS